MNYVAVVSGLAILFLLGTIFLVAPTLRPRSAFGRTVAEDFVTSRDGRRILRSYRLAQLVLIALLLGGFLVLGPFNGGMLAVLVAYVAVASTIWVLAYRSTRPHAVHIPLVRAASLVVNRRIEVVQLAALLPLAVASLILALAWSRIPATYPMHWSGLATPSEWAHRSIATVFGPIAFGVVLVIGLWTLRCYATPGTGRIRWILPCVAWYAAILNAITALLPLRHDPTVQPVLLFYTAPVIILLICGIAIASHLHHPHFASEGDGTPDDRWIGGIFYYNRDDPALWVEKRMGIGWTLNFGRPGSWLILGGILLLALAGLAVALLTHR
jgi:uncharacterized membrane protein